MVCKIFINNDKLTSGEVWGYHSLFNCKSCDINLISDKDNIVNFVTAIVERIDMKAYGQTWCERFATHDPSKGGYSMFQMIETSNISGHFVDENGDCYLDIFSCKPYDIDTAISTIIEFFKPESMTVDVIHR